MDIFDRIAEAQESDDPTFIKARDAIRSLGDILNGGSSESATLGVIFGIMTTHRYLSNKMVVALLTAMGEFGNMPAERVSDGRNEHAHRLCAKLRAALKADIYWKE